MAVKNRAEIGKEYKWDFTHIYPTLEAWEADFDKFSKSYADIEKFKGKLSNKSDALACLQQMDSLFRAIDGIYNYPTRQYHVNQKDSVWQERNQKAGMLYSQLSSSLSFIDPELTALPQSQLEEYLNDSSFSDFSEYLKALIREKAHVLSPEMEKLLADSMDMIGSFENIFEMLDVADMQFPTVKDDDGNDFTLSHGGYGFMLNSKNREVRKNAFDAHYKVYREYNNTFSSIYSGSVKSDWFVAKARNYSSCIEMALAKENLPVAVYDNLISAVSENLSNVHEYVKLRKNLLGGELHMYDMYNPIIEGTEVKLDFLTSYQLVKDGLAPLGEDYAKLLDKAIEENWLDVYETEGKHSGAYSSGSLSGGHPYVLLNYQETLDSIFTTAHEMGHAMHSYKSNATQVPMKAHYKIFLAEIASTVNEVLLLKHMLANETNVDKRKTLLAHYLDSFRTTLFRQTMFAEFESITHKMVESDVPLTAETLNKEYLALNQKYYGPHVTHDDDIQYEWSRIPHFYSSFYVYKYATGFTIAVAIAAKIIAEGESMVNKYMKFLSAGGSDSPLNILKLVDIDMTTNEPFKYAMAEFKNTLDQLKELCHE